MCRDENEEEGDGQEGGGGLLEGGDSDAARHAVEHGTVVLAATVCILHVCEEAVMADTRSIVQFLSRPGTAGQNGILLFMSAAERTAWRASEWDVVIAVAGWSTTRETFFGSNGATLELVVWEDYDALRAQLRGRLFDRFWNEGEVSQRVGELVLEHCV